MAISQFVDLPLCICISYLKGIREKCTVLVLNLMDRFVLPAASALLPVSRLGSKGVLARILPGKILLAVILLTLCLKNECFPRSAAHFMLLPEAFGGKSSDNLYGKVASIEDVVRESDRVEAFCLKQGTNANSTTDMALFIEEMAGNAFRTAIPAAGKQPVWNTACLSAGIRSA